MYKPFAEDVLFLANVTIRRGAANGYVWTSDANGTGSWQVGGGGGSQSLQDVTDIGNTTTNNIELLTTAEVRFGDGGGVLLDNGSRLRKGTIDAGYGGAKGIAQICAVGYELKWEAGRLYIMGDGGTTIREVRYTFTSTPAVTDDNTKGFIVGSRWVLDNGNVYLCSDVTTGAAVWALLPYVDTSGLVPYTGATNDVDLDTHILSAKSLQIKGTAGNGHLALKHQSADATAGGGETALYADVNGDIKYKNDGNYRTTLKTSLNTADRVYTFKDASGTLALTTDLPTPAALTKTDDTNVTLTLGGTPATALLQAASITVGWSGQLAITRGGTGLGTLGTALQQLRVNAGGTALEYFTPSAGGGLTIGTTAITSGTVGRILFEGAGNVLQENAILNLDTTSGLIIGGTTARGTRQTIVNSANTYATKVFVQRNAADSADYTSIRGDGTIDFANLGTSNTFNTLITGGGSALVSIFGTVALQNTLFGAGNSVSYTAGTVGYNFIIGNANIITSTTGTTQINQVLGFNNTIQNSNYCTINGFYTRMNGATRSAILGGRGTSIKEITGSDVTILGTATTPDALSYNNSAVTYFNNDNPSHWLQRNGNIGLFGRKYYILQDSTGAAAYRLSTYMDLTATNTLTIHNGTATAVNIVDAVQIYAADITAGNTATFIRNENGDIIKLYKETTAVAAATLVSNLGTPLTSTDTIGGYTLLQVVKALQLQGLLA